MDQPTRGRRKSLFGTATLLIKEKTLICKMHKYNLSAYELFGENSYYQR